MTYAEQKIIRESIEQAWSTYEGGKKLPTIKQEEELIELFENLVGDLSYSDYVDVLKMFVDPKLKALIQKGRESSLRNRSFDGDYADSYSVASAASLGKEDKKLKEEEIQELEHKKNVDFFFKKDADNKNCNCGAAYTSFPDYHSQFCNLYYVTVLKYLKV